MKRLLVLLFALSVLTSCGNVDSTTTAVSPDESAGSPDVISEWNSLTLKMITDDNITGEFGLRTLGMLHTAMFDAVNSVKKDYSAYNVEMETSADTSATAAAAAAAHRILSTLYPQRAALFDELFNADSSAIGDSQEKEDGIALGQAVADKIIELRSADNSDLAASVPCPDGTAAGEWRRTGGKEPELPGWGAVTPFALSSGSQFRLDGPPMVGSAEYMEAQNETKMLGGANSTMRTAEQTIIAKFWAMGIFNHWNAIAREIAVQQNLNLSQKARLFALLNITMADAQISTWDMKYHFRLWRPVSAMQMEASSPSMAMEATSMWMPLLMTPPFPEYVSAHSQVSAAAAEIITRFFGREDFTVTRMSMTEGLEPRTFSGLSSIVEEIGKSRIYGGIHFRFSDVPAQQNGRQIAAYIYDNFLTLP